ncbi:MAG: hypothetical protein ACOYOF_19240, partial [Verrucomicrobiaceae bacterium]
RQARNSLSVPSIGWEIRPGSKSPRPWLEKVEAGRLPIPPGLCGINLNTVRFRGVLVTTTNHSQDQHMEALPAHHCMVELVGVRKEVFKESETFFKRTKKVRDRGDHGL